MMHTSLLRCAVTYFYGVLLLVIFLVKGSVGVCPGDPNRSVDFVAVDEANYDRNYSSITSEGKRPLGFAKAVWPYNQDDATSPCIRVPDVGSKFLEVMFETFPSSRLCVRVSGNQQKCSDPGTGRLSVCSRPTQDPVYIEFTCDSQCMESDVQFWYRLTLGVKYEEDPEEHWCNDRHSLYPEDLRQLPPDFPIDSQTVTPGNGVSTSFVSTSLLTCLFLVAACRLV